MASSPRREAARPLRCGLVWAATTAGAAALVAWVVPDLLAASTGRVSRVSDVGGHRFDEVLVAGSEAVALVGTGWLWVLVTLVTADAARGRARHRAGVPGPVRRVVLVACGVGLAGAVAGPVHADGGHDPRPGGDPTAAASLVVGLRLPDRASTATRTAAPAVRPGAEARPRPTTVVVAAGDTLWSLAAADLPPGADDARVDAHWRAIHAANRAAIGPDPDLIRPGLRLQLPPPPEPPA